MSEAATSLLAQVVCGEGAAVGCARWTMGARRRPLTLDGCQLDDFVGYEDLLKRWLSRLAHFVARRVS